MARRVLALVLVLPLLLPQGVCVCDLLPRGEASANAVSPACDHDAGCSCRCKKHRHATPGKPRTCSGSVPCQGGDPHSPCCPAKAGGGLWKCDRSDSSFSSLIVFAGPAAFIAAIASSPTLLPPTPLLTSDQPRYLALLNLRI